MKRRSAGSIVGTSVALLILTACAVSEAGKPVTPTDTPTKESSDANRYGAPTVFNPLDAARLLAQPCRTLTEAQLKTIDLPASGIPDIDSETAKYSGPSCTWRNNPADLRVAISFLTGNKNGLADTYRGHMEDPRGYWIETTVDGYPAVFQDNMDKRKTGNCILIVGISDNLTALVDEQDHLGERSCDRAKQIATLMIATLRAGG